MDTRKQIANAEKKVAKAIRQLYCLHKPTTNELYDEQGIYSVTMNQDDLTDEIKSLLPNHGKHGITIHYYREGYIQGPPLRHMLEQKVASLCIAAVGIYKSKENELDLLAQRVMDGIHLDGLTEENIAERANALMKQVSEQTGIALYELYGNMRPKKTINRFVKDIIKKSINVRVNESSTLTFDAANKRFSFDETITATTAHDRGIKQPVANLSYVYEGNYSENVTTVTSSIVKHASLPPIDAINPSRMRDLFEDDMAVTVAACNHIEEVANAMATLRRHGSSNANEKMTLDWTYQLLTTNAFNIEKQASTYGYTINAMLLMSGATLANNLTLNMHVFNAGINGLAYWNVGQKTDTQRRENRKAYLALNTSFENFIKTLPGDFSFIKNAYSFSHNVELEKLYTVLTKELTDNAVKFNEIRKSYNDASHPALRRQYKTAMKDRLEMARKINDDIRHVTYRMEVEQKKHWKQQQANLTKLLSAIEQGEQLQNLKAALSKGGETAKQATDDIMRLSVLFYKSHMDELYYSGAYREPEKAALFNAYMSAYQRLVGVMASTGCKSGHDRTYVARLVLAAMEGRDLKSIPLPPDYLKDHDAYFDLRWDLGKIAMSNTAMFGPINDTNGGTPKVDNKKFNILNLIPGIHHISKLGQFAAHKMKSCGIFNAIVQAVTNWVKAKRPTVRRFGMFATSRKKPITVAQPAAPSSSPAQSVI